MRVLDHQLLLECQKGRIENVKACLQRGSDPNACDNSGRPVLFFAISSGVLDLVEWMIRAGASPSAADKNGLNALHWAIESGNVDAALWIIRSGLVDLNAQTKKGDTALLIAVRKRAWAVVDALLQKGADPNISNALGVSPILMAAEKGDIEYIDRLVAHGGRVDHRDLQGRSALHYAAKRDQRRIVRHLIVVYHLDPNVVDQAGVTPAGRAAQNNHLETYKLLVKLGANPHHRDHKGQSILHYLFASTRRPDPSEFVKHVIHKDRIPINVQDHIGYTPLVTFIKNGDLDGAKLLLALGADPNIKDKYGNTAVMASCQRSDYKMLRLILDYGGNPDIQNNDGETPLIFLSRNQSWNEVSLLLDYGANPNIQNRQGNTALMYAARHANNEILEKMLLHGADPNIQNKNGTTALMLAADERFGGSEKVETLLRFGADPNLQDNEGFTALMMAARKLDNSWSAELIVNELLKRGADPTIISRTGDSAMRYFAINRYLDELGIIENYLKKVSIKKFMSVKIDQEKVPFARLE